jgi:hypothetical protein
MDWRHVLQRNKDAHIGWRMREAKPSIEVEKLTLDWERGKSQIEREAVLRKR